MPPRDQISRVTKMLADEYGTASNIKSRVNRQSVLAAITSAQQRLKLYNKVPPNGLVLYTGTIVTEDGKEKKKKLIGKYFEEISQDTGKYVFGVDDTLKALEMGAVETLIVWGNLDINRYVLKNSDSGEIIIKHLNKDHKANQSNFRDPANNAELEVQEKVSLLEWFANEYKCFGCTLEVVTNKSQESSQFCRGFGGIGGILCYQLDMRSMTKCTKTLISSRGTVRRGWVRGDLAVSTSIPTKSHLALSSISLLLSVHVAFLVTEILQMHCTRSQAKDWWHILSTQWNSRIGFC
ncbi:hypothetical protein BHE74_00047263 [Ensete ventricosum]|nr:hypothetical protein BHE74_00047263 [Ensete ventricosum]